MSDNALAPSAGSPDAEAQAELIARLRERFDINEEEAISAIPLAERHNARPRRPRCSIDNRGGTTNVAPDGETDRQSLEQVRIHDAFGTKSGDFSAFALKALAGLQGKPGQLTEEDLNAALAVVAAIEPQNEAEALLAVQMVAANRGALQAIGWMQATGDVEHTVQLGGLANKFMRTFATQMEALAKLRRGGEQVVRHVHVNEGGQAVIAGTINQGQGGGKRKHGA